jgi:hypothetical protein
MTLAGAVAWVEEGAAAEAVVQVDGDGDDSDECSILRRPLINKNRNYLYIQNGFDTV